MSEKSRKWLSALAAMIAIVFALPQLGMAGEPKVFDIQVSEGKVVGGDETVRVSEGDDVVLRWHVDRAAEVHRHGYDIKTPISPDAVAKTVLTARATGRFPITAHGPGGEHVTLIYLEVYPR